jgi:argininosuccinate synthase
MKDRSIARIVLAYSGGLDSSAIPWLADKYGAEIIAVTIDLGQGRALEAVRDRALASGALRAHVLDVRDDFAKRYLLRALRAGALYDDTRSMSDAIGLPLIAQTLVEIAAIEQTTAIAHGAAGYDARIGVAMLALNPAVTIVAPEREWEARHAEPVIASTAECPHEPAYVEIAFNRGVPSAINGVAMSLVDLIGSLDFIAGAHGVGRRGKLETPASIVLHAAHRDLHGTGSMSDETRRSLQTVRRKYVGILDSGAWFGPERQALDAEVDRIQEHVSGIVRLKLFKGGCAIVDRRLLTADC